MRILKRTVAWGLAVTLLAAPLVGEVWNDPSGVAVTSTSQTIRFPRPMSAVLVINDDTTDSVFIRLFTCNEIALTASKAATTGSLEIKAAKSRSFTRNEAEVDFYCAISLFCSNTATARIEAK